MARFYDSANDSELARVGDILKKGGIEFSLGNDRLESSIKEILVAEEDVCAAEDLVCRHLTR